MHIFHTFGQATQKVGRDVKHCTLPQKPVKSAPIEDCTDLNSVHNHCFNVLTFELEDNPLTKQKLI